MKELLDQEITFLDDHETLVDLEARRKLTSLIKLKSDLEYPEIFARMLINKFRLKLKYSEEIEEKLQKLLELLLEAKKQ
jgi:hypothetical protein